MKYEDQLKNGERFKKISNSTWVRKERKKKKTRKTEFLKYNHKIMKKRAIIFLVVEISVKFNN